MPIEPRIFIKTGIAYLFLTFLAGGIMTIMEATGHAVPRVFKVEHGHMGFVGWLVNVVVGVALWMFPLDRTRFAPDERPLSDSNGVAVRRLPQYWLAAAASGRAVVSVGWRTRA